jgi:putative ATP-dependent endonuclease of OLD family
MQIQHLHIKNFRSLRDVELRDLENLNIFIGKNSSGKSNLLEALDLFFSDFSLVGGNTAGLNQYYWFNKKTKDPIEFEIIFELSEEEVVKIFPPEILKEIKRFSSTRAKLGNLIVRRRIVGVAGAWETTVLECSGASLVKDNKSKTPDEILRPLIEAYANKEKAALLKIRSITPDELNQILSRITELIKGQFRLITQIRDVKNPIAHRVTLVDSELQNALWRLDQSIQSEEEDKFMDIERSFTHITDKRLDPAQGQAYIKRQGRRFPLHLEGGGIQASIQLVYIIKNEIGRCSIFGIEEPESHSHSDLQRKLFVELKSLSENCQLLINTHSPTFTDRVDLKKVWISKFVNGETIFERASELKEITEELNIKPSDVLFFADRILFVEGKSEEIVIPIFAQKLDICLEDVAIISVEGKSKARLNLKTWIKITRGMLPMFLLLDKDAETEIEQLEAEKLIKPGKYHVWQEGSIESYYPLPLLKKTLNELNQLYSLGMDVNTQIKRIENGELPPDRIDLGEKRELLDKKWKVLLAESIAKFIGREKQPEIPEEVRIALKNAVEA